MLWKFVPFQKPHADASFRRELGALKRLQVWLAILVGIVGFGGFFATYTYISHTMTSVAGLPAAWLPLVVALYGVGMVVGNIVGGRIADKSVMGTIYWVLPGTAVALVVYAVARPLGLVRAGHGVRRWRRRVHARSRPADQAARCVP